jgi:DNA gyrase subunit B
MVVSSYTDNDITIPKNDMYGIRMSPSSVIGEMGPKGQVLVIRENVDNSVDEHAAIGTTEPIEVYLRSYNGGYQVTIVDKGRGIPLNSLEVLLTKLYASGKQNSGAYTKNTAGAYGIGVVASCAASSVVCAISKRPEGTAKLLIKEGEILESVVTKEDHGNYGTTIMIQSDDKIFIDAKDFIGGEGERLLDEYIEFISYVSEHNVNIHYYKHKQNKIPLIKLKGDIKNTLNNIFDMQNLKLVFKTEQPKTMKKYIQKYYGITDKNIVFSMENINYDYNDKTKFGFEINFVVPNSFHVPSNTIVISAVNGVFMKLQHSDHIVVFYNTLKSIMSNYFDEGDVEIKAFFDSYYKLPILPSIIAAIKGAKYIGAAKEGYVDIIFRQIYGNILSKLLYQREEEIKELFELLLPDIEERYKIYNKRQIKTKGLSNVYSSLEKPDNYKPCRSKDNRVTEIFFTEGETAGNTLKAARDADFQAIYFLTGKTVNAVKEKKKANKDAVFKDIKQILGVSETDTDLNNMNFSKIIILTDADIDGLHIASLLCSIFYTINPLILAQGRVVVANPPLYCMKYKNKTLFLKDYKAKNDELIEKVYKPSLDIFVSIKDGMNYVDKKLENGAYRDVIYMVKNINTQIITYAKNTNVDPTFLEIFALYYKLFEPDNVNVEGISKLINKPVLYDELRNTLSIDFEDGGEFTIPLHGLYEKLKTKIYPILAKINYDKYVFKITSKNSEEYNQTPVTICYLNNILDTLASMVSISRYKGIGVLNPEDLYEICVNPRTRSFITITELGETEKIYRMMGVDPTYRKQFIEGE